MSKQINLDDQSVLRHLQSRLIGERSATSAEIERELKSLARQLHKLEVMTAQLYEDRVTGDISEETFAETAIKHEAERQQKAQRLFVLEQSDQEVEAKLSDIRRWIRLIRENAAIDDVDRDLLDVLIERVEVGDIKVENGAKSQEIRIIFKFVGNV